MASYSRNQGKFPQSQSKRHFAAVAFLRSISLDGSYKDSSWALEYARQQEAVKTGEMGINSTTVKCLLSRSSGGVKESKSKVKQAVFSPEGSEPISSDLGHHRKGSSGNEKELTHVVNTNANNAQTDSFNNSIRRRAHTLHNEPKYSHQVVSRQDSSGQGRRAHFSSSESVEHPCPKSHHMSTTNISESSSLEGKAEVKMVRMCDVNPNLDIKRERLIVLVSRRTMVLIFSILPYSRNTRPSRSIGVDRPLESGLRRRNTSGSRPIPILLSDSPIDPLEQLINSTNEEVSYGYLLRSYNSKSRQQSLESNTLLEEPDLLKRLHVQRCPSYEPSLKFQDASYAGTGSSTPSESESHDLRRYLTQYAPAATSGNRAASCLSTYSPHLLDDPEFRAGKHRTLLTFPSYITSVIDYCKPSDMKKELNDKFRDRFPEIQLTLSKLKSLKREMRKVVRTECNIDLLTVAQAFVYFEKLILGSFVTKYNRKFCAGACILLSAKLNDVKGSSLHNLLDIIERTFRVSRKDLITFEFAVLVALEFTLHLPTWEVFPHYQRLLYES